MFDYTLFLGMPVSSSFSQQLEDIPSAIKDAFIQNHSPDYLQEIEHEGLKYLGKSLVSPLAMDALESQEAHILSLLKRLNPDYPYHEQPLVLLALQI